VALGIEARKAILTRCKMIQPFIPPVVDGKPWESYPTQVIASERRFFSFEPGAKWHGFSGYACDQYCLLYTSDAADDKNGVG
ncbi:ornithine decarboxylase, partial [Escherichia coli]|nr:ornithine decarboxylase [Escherichia coli]